MTQRSLSLSILLLSACTILQGCGSVKRTLGIERDAPDEFAVTPCDQPLDMPPNFFSDLPKPRPGAPRPQEVKGRKEQQKGRRKKGRKEVKQRKKAKTKDR